MTGSEYRQRGYREKHRGRDLVYFNVLAGETDLSIGARRMLKEPAQRAALFSRSQVLEEISARPKFLTSLEPLSIHGTEPPLVRAMLEAGRACSVGPMAAVAGAIAEYVARELEGQSTEVIVENGGDVFFLGRRPRLAMIFAGDSPVSGKFAIKIDPAGGMAVCTSSGTVGHSKSFGRADAAIVVSRSGALADAAATRLGNLIKAEADIAPALDEVCSVEGVLGAVAVLGGAIGAKGEIEFEQL